MTELAAGVSAAALLWCAGFLLFWVAGVRLQPWVAAASAPLAFLVLALSAWSQILLPFRYGLTSVLLSYALVLTVAAVAGTGLRRSRARGRARPHAQTDGLGVGAGPSAEEGTAARSAWPVTLGVVLVLVLSTGSALLVMRAAGGGSFEIASQTWDAMFDLNAIRDVVDTGVIAPTRISDFAYPLPVHTYYPTSFHALGALILLLFGGDAVVAGNLAAGVIAGLLWPSAVMVATGFVLGRRPFAVLASGVLCLGFWGQPWGPLGWGVLWATATAYLFVPIAFAGFLALWSRTRAARSRRAAAAMTVTGVAAVALMHPRIAVVTVVAFCAISELEVLLRAVAAWRSGRRRAAAAWAGLIALAVPVLVVVVFFVGRGNSSFVARGWQVEFGAAREALFYLVNGPAGSTPQVVTAGLLLLGVWSVVRRPWGQGVAAAYLFAVLLDVMTATVRTRWFNGINRFWYTDRYRTLELPAFPAILLAVAGAERLWLPIQRLGRRTQWSVAVLATALVAFLGSLNAVGTMRTSYVNAANDPKGSLVSPDEVGWFRRVGAVVPRGERVLNNANDGSALLYAYTGVKPVFLIAGNRASTLAGFQLWEKFNTLEPRNMCDAAALDNVHWILNNGEPYSAGDIGPLYAPGMQVPADYWATELVLQQGERKLYRITRCPNFASPSAGS